jgi:hypothetical protein
MSGRVILSLERENDRDTTLNSHPVIPHRSSLSNGQRHGAMLLVGRRGLSPVILLPSSRQGAGWCDAGGRGARLRLPSTLYL